LFVFYLFVSYLLFAFVKALHDGGSPWYLRGLIREPLRKIGVVLLHDVEHRFPGEPAMVLGKQSVHVCELFVGHGHRASAAIRKYTATCLSRATLQRGRFPLAR
jgi:hypothetical protein